MEENAITEHVSTASNSWWFLTSLFLLENYTISIKETCWLPAFNCTSLTLFLSYKIWGLSAVFLFFIFPAASPHQLPHTDEELWQSSTRAAHSQLVSSGGFLRSDNEWITRKEGGLEFSFWKYFALCHAQWVSTYHHYCTVELWACSLQGFFSLYMIDSTQILSVCFRTHMLLFPLLLNRWELSDKGHCSWIIQLRSLLVPLCPNMNKILQNWKLTELIQCLTCIPLICSAVNMISISCERLEKQ